MQFLADPAAFAPGDDGATAHEIGGSGQLLRPGVRHGGVDSDAVLSERGSGLRGVEAGDEGTRNNEPAEARRVFG